MERLLPRHVQIIYLINALHSTHARKKASPMRALANVSLIDEHNGPRCAWESGPSSAPTR